MINYYVELGTLLGENYSSRETVQIFAYVNFQKIQNTLKYILSLATPLNIELPQGLLNEENLTFFILGFHNGTVSAGRYDPADVKLF